jgi:cytochrome c556
MKNTIRGGLLSLIVISPFFGLAFAHSGATGVVKERMELMKTIGDAMKGLAEEVKRGDAADPERILSHASTIQENSGTAMLAVFPEDSLMPPSEAAPAIWDEWDRFEEIAMQLSDRVDAIRQSPEDKVAFAELAGTCKACHADFRQKK